MNKISLIVVVMILSGTAVIAEMRGAGMGMGMRYGYGLGSYGDPELHLRPDQAEKVGRLQRHYLEEVQQWQRKFMLKRAELKMLDSSPVEDTSKLNRQRQELEEIRKNIREIWLNFKMECQALLTSEQLEKLGSLENRPGHRQGMGWSNH